MRMAGHFGRRMRGWAKANQVPVIECRREEDKHGIAEEYLKIHPNIRGLFLILVGRAVATVWTVHRSRGGVILNLEAKPRYINHYCFHILDPDWGHITIKMSGHPPLGAQIMLNGHEYVACRARKVAIPFTKEGNCFTIVSKPADLAKVADTLSEARNTGRLRQVCERWIYTSCLCFALDLKDQQSSGFRYQYSIYQVEYSRNLIFHLGWTDGAVPDWRDISSGGGGCDCQITKGLVPKKGLEPPRPCGHMDLNHARLPIPPLRLSDWEAAC